MPATILDPILSELHGKDPKDQHAAAINPKIRSEISSSTNVKPFSAERLKDSKPRSAAGGGPALIAAAGTR